MDIYTYSLLGGEAADHSLPRKLLKKQRSGFIAVSKCSLNAANLGNG